MPLTVTGENYRDFSEPRFFEATTTSEVEQIRNPVNKAHALVGAADGSMDFSLWKFDSTSTAAASATVLVPLNPFFTSTGRWIFIPTGSSGSLSASAGFGSPEGVVTRAPGATYWDITNQIFYVKNTGTGNTGWLSLLTL